MLSHIWSVYLYQPLFNALIWIYENIAGGNMGWAVVWLTIFLRLLLLPLTIISEYNAIKHKVAVAEAEKALEAYKGDKIAQKEAARNIMRKYHISPWAKVLTLVVQALVLVLLYQVFIRGITNDRIVKILYPIIDFPGRINTNFYGFDIGAHHNVLWAAIAAVYLFFAIYFENRNRASWEKPDVYYALFFPLFTFVFLWYLPMVKSLFILTTMLFSDSIKVLRTLVMSVTKSGAKHTDHPASEQAHH